MTNLQLFLSIAIPSLLVVLSWMSNNARFAAHDKRFDDIDRRLTEVDRRFSEVDRRFNEIDRRFSDVIGAQHGDALEIMRNMTALHERLSVVETRQANAA